MKEAWDVGGEGVEELHSVGSELAKVGLQWRASLPGGCCCDGGVYLGSGVKKEVGLELQSE